MTAKTVRPQSPRLRGISPRVCESVDPSHKSVVMRKIADLKIAARKPRSHSPQQLAQLAASIRRFRFNNPILTDQHSRVLAGIARIEAAKLLGLTEVPTLQVGHMTDAEKRAYIIADNRIAEKAGWDRSVLSLELEELQALGFNVELTGFTTAEVDLLLETETEPAEGEVDPDDAVPPVERQAVSQTGDIWVLGPHRLACGDALSAAIYEALLRAELAQMIFTDAPFNLPIRGHVSSSQRLAHREFVMASGEMSEGEFIRFLRAVFRHLVAFSADGSIHFQCMDWRHMREMLEASQGVYRELKNLCVWTKNNGGMGSFYRSQHELVFVFKNGKAAHINNFGLGDKGRYRTNVWSYPGVNAVDPNRRRELEMHPTVKPLAMVADAIRDCSKRSGIVLDPFSGSGTTILAAERTGRQARAIEIDPLYVDVAIRRWQERTGRQAVLLATGQAFEAVQRLRLGEEDR